MSGKPVVPRILANRDVEEAVDYFLGEAGDRTALAFVEAVGHAYENIARHPAAGSPRYAQELDLSGLRFWPLRRFPYLVFYVEHDDHIDVWRLLRGDRDIPAWMREPEDT